MKYFSIKDWKTWEPWDQIQENRKRYQEYIQTISPQLPPDLRLLCDFSPEGNPQRVFLNDSQVAQITSSFETRTVTLVLDGEYTDKANRQLGLRRFFLNYKDVTEFRIEGNAEDAYQPGPDVEASDALLETATSASISFDDHGWNEIELLEEGLFEHRMLFASGTEIAIRFHDFHLDYSDAPHVLTT